jgi:hypothetical protein
VLISVKITILVHCRVSATGKGQGVISQTGSHSPKTAQPWGSQLRHPYGPSVLRTPARRNGLMLLRGHRNSGSGAPARHLGGKDPQYQWLRRALTMARESAGAMRGLDQSELFALIARPLDATSVRRPPACLSPSTPGPSGREFEGEATLVALTRQSASAAFPRAVLGHPGRVVNARVRPAPLPPAFAPPALVATGRAEPMASASSRIACDRRPSRRSRRSRSNTSNACQRQAEIA